IRAAMPELPDQKKERFISDFGLSAYDAGVLVVDKETAAYFETAAEGRDSKLVANWVISELFGRLNKAGLAVTESPVSARAIGELVDLISDDTISGRIAKDVFDEMFETGKGAAAIVDEKGLRQITDTSELEQTIQAILEKESEKLAEYRAGSEKLFGWFVGQVMKATQGKANPKMVNELLKKMHQGSRARGLAPAIKAAKGSGE
ncbi:MAG: Asp-tRNA(Asn)/Glu-tRNA(Gln) amidotransferase GatCAB subunit B, partial [Alphaproteobacteria bacterium]